MKYLAILFGIYISLLTLIPCGDNVDVPNHSNKIATFTKNIAADSHSGEDFCPPFCSCTCCSVQRDFITSVEHTILIEHIPVLHGQYRMPNLLDLALEIYQPPQIV